MLAVGSDGDEVLDHCRSQHASSQRPAIGVEPEQDNVPIFERATRIDPLAPGSRIEPVADIRFGEDR